jgi:hypothetical protein
MKKLFSVITAAALAVCSYSIPLSSLASSDPTLTIDMSEKTGAMYHGSAGFLYGLGSDGTPDVNLITPLKPSTAVQKAPDGMQHPTGDVLDVAETFVNAGGSMVQIYLQDTFALWPYEYTTFDDYLDRIREMVPKIVALRESDPSFEGKLVYIPFNEPDGIWYQNVNSSTSVQNTFNQNWKQAYDLIRSLDPDALIGGVSYATYQSKAMESWLKFASENDCEPDCITWHELQTDKLSSFKSHLEHYRKIEKQCGMTEREIIINEYAPQNDCSVPGKLVNWIALFEENKVSGCLPYWHNAGNLNDIAADNNEPNGAWWLYKWYGDMSGETLKVSTSTSRDSLYGLASIDDNKKSANVIFGGVDGSADIVLKNISDSVPFEGDTAVDIKVEATYWTAFHGVAAEPSVILSGTYPVVDGSVTVNLDNMDAYSAYNIIVTKASDPSRAGIIYKGFERKTYEAEDAVKLGNVYDNSSPWTYAYSNNTRLSGIKTASDGYDLSFSVSQSGYYKMDLIYGNGYGLNTSDTSSNNPQTLKATLRFDKQEPETILLENTLRDQMAGMYSEYIYLSEGSHTLHVRGSSDNEGDFSNDCVSFTYCGSTVPSFDSVYEAELGDFNILNGNSDTTLTTENSVKGYSASGYITGLSKRSVEDGGGVRFTVVAPDNGLYSLTLRYSAESDTAASIYLGNTALQLDNLLTKVSLPASENFNNASVTAFLQKGINIIDISSDSEISLDSLRVKKAESDETITVQAEDASVTGNAQVSYSDYASEGAYVKNIEGGTDDSLILNVTAPHSGHYKMTIHYSVSELFGAHTYNAQLVDRYASFSVNGEDATRMYFKNSYSDENWRTRVLDVNLNEGDNTITVTNDNWRILQCGTGSSSNINYQTLVNYAPNFDCFEFTPALTAVTSSSDECSVSYMSTSGGEVSLDKNLVTRGENVTLSFKKEYSDGSVEVLANGEDVSNLISGDSLVYAVNSDTDFRVRFILPENLDNIIKNSSFGTGDLSFWNGEGSVEGSDNHIAKIGSISQTVSIPDGYYTVTFKAKGENLTANAGFSSQSFALTDEWQSYSVRALSKDGEFTLSLSGDAYVDDFSLLQGSVDDSLLYFVNAGDSNPQTLSDGDSFGIYNSVTDQFFAKDSATGMEWGVMDVYTPSESYPNLLTGAKTWPYEYDTSDSLSKVESFRYAKDQPNYGQGEGITYKFELPDGLYSFEVGFYAPSGWMSSVSRKASLTMNDEVLASGIVPKSDVKNPIIVKAVSSVSGGYASLNLKLDSDGVGGPMISYIKIADASPEPECVKLDSSRFTVTGSATWNNQSFTVAKYAFDNDTSTYFDGISGGYLTADLGGMYSVAAIGFVPRSSWSDRMTGSVFYASKDGTIWDKLFTVPTNPPYDTESKVFSNAFLSNDNVYRYIKYQNPYDYCNVAEIYVYKEDKTPSFANFTEDFTIESLSQKDGSFVLHYTSATDATLIVAEENDNTVTKVTMTPLDESGTITFSPNEKVYIWDLASLKPLAEISY